MIKSLALGAALGLGAGLSMANAADMTGPVRSGIAPLSVPASLSGFYFGTRNGFGAARDTRFDIGGGGVNVTNQYELGVYNGLMAGYNFGPVLGGVGLRGELEFGRSQFSIKTHTVNGARVAGIDSFGDLRSFGGFANVFLDFNLATLAGLPADSLLARITPYVGGGVGYSQVELRRMGVSATGVIMDDSDGRFAYNLAAGVGISVFDRTTLEIGYRYLAVPDLQFVARDGTRTRTSAGANMVTLGMRRQF
ncbi:outer membrane beta-barrel protein [Phreatobacter sp.]|uniref:outer membrane protein n=1 Tax=Phreatobacter sp. TaxID=1966341 RepID=UPI0022BB2B9D|nr:outer membrane beta-barrel protein [Phreatobacter sp.]MCZ8314838.1 outer membrane beta-barrel protein [Phreatobacter sp.]